MKKLKLFVILAVTIVMLIAILTFPLLFNLDKMIPGFFSTDESYAALWYNWRIKYSLENHLSLLRTDFIGYPFGINLFGSGIASFGWLIWVHFLSAITTHVLCYNLQIVINLILAWFFAYFLFYRFTSSCLPAIFAATAFTFCPYQFARIWQHLSLTYNQWLPLTFLGVIMLKENPGRRSAVIFFLSLLALFSFDFSISYIGSIMLATIFFYILLFDWKEKLASKKKLSETLMFLRKVLLILALVFLVLLPQFLPIIINRFKLSPSTLASAHNPYHRSFEDLFAQSARPLSYLLPVSVHPVFGGFTEGLVGTSVYGTSLTEHALYLGWLPLILAFFAVTRWLKERKKASSRWFPHAQDFYIGLLLIIGIVAWLFSQPPWWSIGKLKILMPSFFMYKILPMYRAYCRFGILLMLAVSGLAGIGFKLYLDKFKGWPKKAIVGTLLSGLLLFEFWNWPPYKVIDVSRVPGVYYWLKDQPKDVVIAEYPMDADSPNEMYKFYQTVHERRIINGAIPGTPASLSAQKIIKLSEDKTVGMLKERSVKYILVHHDLYLDTGLSVEKEELEKIPRNKKLRLIKSFPAENCADQEIGCTVKSGIIDVYEISETDKLIKER